MELKTKYQYTYFIHPYVIDENKYDKYILKLLKDKKCKFKIFQKEKDLDIYNFFLPNIRNYYFPTFELRGEKLKEFNKLEKEKQKNIISKQNVACFTYDLAEDIQGKVGEEDGIFFRVEKIEIICFKTGICFFTLKTILENTNNFSDLLNFNYRFKDIKSEFLNLKSFENIKIQTNTFADVKDLTELIDQITGINRKAKHNQNKEDNILGSAFYTYSYACVESNNWNEKTNFDYLSNDFLKYSNVLPKDFNSDFDKSNVEQRLHVIEKMKYYKTAITKTSSNIFCSGIDTYNYTKLPYKYENEYFYTYILALYKSLFLRKLDNEFREYDKIVKMRARFLEFSKVLWNKEITVDDEGALFFTTLGRVFELENCYADINNKYEVIYKDLNIEKNNNYYIIIVMLLIFSLIFNTINILFLMYYFW